MSRFTESVVEEAALECLEGLGYAIKHGPDIAPGELGAERADYAQLVLGGPPAPGLYPDRESRL